MCSNGKILNGVLRGLWNRSDALITTDCGAVGMMQVRTDAYYTALLFVFLIS